MYDVKAEARKLALCTCGIEYADPDESHDEDCTALLQPAIESALLSALEEAAKVAGQLIMLPADECNVPFSEEVDKLITVRRETAKYIASAIRALGGEVDGSHC